MTDPTLDILKECGPMDALLWHVARANDDAGLPNTYVALAEQVGRNPTHVMRICKRLEAAGFVEVVRSEGKSVASVVRPRIPGVTLGVTLGVTKTSHQDENVTPKSGQIGVTLGVTSPPTPPVVVNVSSDEHRNQREPPPLPPKGGGAGDPKYSDDFLSFWSSYPKGHGSKVKAWGEWKRLNPDRELRAEIVAAVAAWKESDRWRRGYIKDAERFLSHRMWETEPPTASPPRSNGANDLPSRDSLRDQLRKDAERMKAGTARGGAY